MAELKDLTFLELIITFREALRGKPVLAITDNDIALQEQILSRFAKLKNDIAEKDKVIELMAQEIQEYTSYAPIEVIIQDFAGRVKRQLQADKEKADE